MKHYLGIEIGGTKFQAVVGNQKAAVLERYRAAVDKERGAASIRDEICNAIERFKNYKPVSIGVGFGGPIDSEKGRIITSHHVKGWKNFPIKSWLEKYSGLPVKTDNDANTAGLAESVLGYGKNIRRIFYVCLGSGMGGGMIVNQQIYHGEIPGEAEIGLMPADRNGNNMESLCCGWSVDKRIRVYAHKNPSSPIAVLTKGFVGGEAKYLVQAIKKGDRGADTILNETADSIAFALSYAVHLFHPKIIIVGGGLSLIGNPLFSRINKNMPHYVAKALLPAPKVVMAKLGEDVVCIGALLLAMQAGSTPFGN
jgi:glucokinase